MSGPRFAYSSTVIAPGHMVASGVVAATLLTVGSLAGGPVWLSALAAVLVVLAGIHLGTVRVTVGAGFVRIAEGPWRRPGRLIPAGAVVDAHAENMGWAQISGIGVPLHWDTTRLTIRPGPTLVLRTRTGEHIRVSTTDPGAAAALINTSRGTPAPGGA